MSQNDCKKKNPCQDPCADTKDPKKAVELSIVILVDNENNEEKSSCPPTPCPCPPPCCLPPCCMPMPYCMPPCCPCMRSPCAGQQQQALPAPCLTPKSSGTCSTKPICVDLRGKSLERTQSSASCQTTDPCGRTQSSTSCQTADRCQTRSAATSQTACGLKQSKSTVCQTQATPCRPKSEKGKQVCRTKSGKQRPTSGESPEDFPSVYEPDEYKPEDLMTGPYTKKEHHKHHHKHHHHKHHHRKKSGERRASIPADQIDFTQCSAKQLTFVQYFLKREGGGPYVTNLSENKDLYEKECKARLSKFPKHVRSAAQDYFIKIVETINLPTPDTQNTEIKHYHVMKYLHPVLAGLSIDMPQESHAIHRYHNYILTVAKTMDKRIAEKQTINPTCMVELETELLAGIVCRFFPVFIRIKDELVKLIKQGRTHETLTPDEFLKQLKKLALCLYVEIACINTTFTNTLTSLSNLPDVKTQDMLMQQIATRRKHARHATKWAARCFGTTLLYYFMLDM